MPAKNKPSSVRVSERIENEFETIRNVSKRVNVDRQLTLVDILDGDLSRVGIKSSRSELSLKFYLIIGASEIYAKLFEKKMVSIIRILVSEFCHVSIIGSLINSRVTNSLRKYNLKK